MQVLWPSCVCLQAMFVDFGFAAHTGGHCYLRYDDTNPDAEKMEYITHIQVS
jgi:glutaminyl-tRNA synthetase